MFTQLVNVIYLSCNNWYRAIGNEEGSMNERLLKAHSEFPTVIRFQLGFG